MDESKFGQTPAPQEKKQKGELSASQKEAVKAIEAILKTPLTTNFRVILLEGLSGVGKSYVLDTISPGLPANGAIVLESEHYFIKKDIKAVLRTGTENFIVPTLARASGEMKSELSATKAQLERVALMAMDRGETEKLVKELATGKKLNLSLEKIAEYSMGVPLVLNRLLHSEITEEMAIGIATQYLKENTWGSKVSPQKFLKIPIPDVVKAVLKEGGYAIPSFYNHLPVVLKNWEEALKKDKDVESPFFVAPESIEIYNTMFESEDCFLEIFALELSYEDQQKFEDAFPHHYQEINSRIRMFGGEYRKITIESGGRQIMDSEGWESKYFPNRKSKRNSAYIQKHDHQGVVIGTVRDAWAAESFFQQRGIAYEVHNPLYGKNYRFNPQTKHIEFLETPVR